MTSTPGTGALPPSALQPYANARMLLFSNAVPGVLDSERTGRFLFEGFIKRLRGISSKENAPGLDTGDAAGRILWLISASRIATGREAPSGIPIPGP